MAVTVAITNTEANEFRLAFAKELLIYLSIVFKGW